MALTGEARKADLVERLVVAARGRVAAELADSVERFVRRYYAGVAADDMVYTAFETLLGAVLSLWELGLVRQPGTVKIRLFNPVAWTHGWELEHTVLEIVNDDMPFLVDSVTAELTRTEPGRAERNIHLVVHPVVRVRRDAEGHLLEVGAPTAPDFHGESHMHIELDQETASSELEDLQRRLEKVLADVRVAVTDWQPMRQRLSGVLGELGTKVLPFAADEIAEVKAFLQWLDDHFTLLGYRRYELIAAGNQEYLQVDAQSGLGILRELRPESLERAATPFPAEFSKYARRSELVIITKANNRSTVHRSVHMDRVSLKRYGGDGQVVGEDRFLGLFTSNVYNQSVLAIPLLRRKVRRALERSGFEPSSHDGKALLQIYESFPRDEAFQVSEDELFEIGMGILQLQERQRVALFARKDAFERFVSCLVFIPRDRYNTELRLRVQHILEEAYGGPVTAFYTQVTDAPLARCHFIVKTTPGQIPAVDVKRLEAYLAEAARSWTDRLREALVAARGEDEGIETFQRYRNAFPTAYRERFGVEAALYDIAQIEKVAGSTELRLDLYAAAGAAATEVRAKIYDSGSPEILSDVLPRLENMGLKVVTEVPYEVRPAGKSEEVWIRDFGLLAAAPVALEAVKERFEETFRCLWNGDLEDDGLNRLVLVGDLDWHEVVILRAYSKYLRQTGVSFTDAYLRQALGNNPVVATLLARLFLTRFDPRLSAAEREQEAAIKAEIQEALEGVTNVDEDRILRRFLNLVESTLRTNYFQRDAEGRRKPYLSFKLDSRGVEELPLPRPLYEIFVYSPRMEGVHLRGGKVARGGIRWSDRREDFRTEILGLMKAQMVKNAVIVPVGAKGGFVLKRPPVGGGREEIQQEGIACYQTLVRGMLDLTDNLVGDKVVPPPDVVRRDDDDTYLVVAADKGTATFSDIANGVAAEYRFWLGDAFASGGSVGYDHKKMAITARGAWEAVKRHFRELGTDIQQTDFTVVGVGDMSGDVFGNGMLLSPHIKLLGAFNHLHIFVDPAPDPAKSLDERRRLFDLPRSSWSDYSPAVLSPGGAVFERKAKSITVSEQVQRVFGLPSTTLTPSALIQAMLRAPADLLFFGGIGTFVKASSETDAQVGDRANDALRVNGQELRARVIGEGANLGCTQRGRIEFALTRPLAPGPPGGKLNTDAIDNSGGVDCSDHEVNIKILLDDAVRRGDLAPAARLDLLVEMTDEVAELVLRDNYQQSQAISVTAAQGTALLDAQARLMRGLERAGKLDRRLEALPDEETVAERAAKRLGLTRPEIAVLLAYSKISLYSDLLASDLPDDPLLRDDLFRYFPTPLRERHPPAVERHRLRREIIATHVTNSMVNRVGPTFVSSLGDETGRAPSEIARAYTICRDAFDLRSLWDAIEALDNRVAAAVQLDMLIEIGRLLESTTLWFLRRRGESLDISTQAEEFRPRVAALAERLPQLVSPQVSAAMQARAGALVKAGVASELATRVASLPVLASATDIVLLARDRRNAVEEIAHIYFALGARFGLDWLRTTAAGLVTDTPWQKAAVALLIDELFGIQRELTARILVAAGEDAPAAVVSSWLSARGDATARAEQLLTELRAAPVVDLAMLVVASRQLRALVESPPAA